MTLSRPGIVLALVLAAVAPIAAQEPTPGRPIRLLLTSTKLAAVTDEPLHFRLVRVTVPAGQSFAYAGPHGMICPVVGGLSVTVAGERKSVQEGEAVYVARGQQATLTAGQGGPATFLHYLLASSADLGGSFHARPASVTDLYRTPEGIPNLKPGPYEFTMTRVVAQPRSPAPPMHHRSGAALYYVLSGAWTIHLEDRTEPRGRGLVQYEPNGFIHTWENVGDTPGALLQANISPEGAPEIIFLPRPAR
jgi:quercetin dioxygenase-like cupin family protein